MSLTADCISANGLWLKMGQSDPLPSDCCNKKGISCSGNRIIGIWWQSQGLKNSIPPEIGTFTELKYLGLRGNALTGPIPNLWNLQKLVTLELSHNQLSGSIPPVLAHLNYLNWLDLSSNQLSGPIPSALGYFKNIYWLDLSSNQLSGPIPPTLGYLKNLRLISVYNNQLTGYPSTLKAEIVRVFPNPMSDVPYDVVAAASAGSLSTVTWNPFLNTLNKRQGLSARAPISTDELLNMCDLRSLPAGCIAGVFNKYCSMPTNPTLLLQCHDAFNRAFGASVFKTLGDTCPAWKDGPNSQSCATAVRNFKASSEIGTGSSLYTTLDSRHAEELRKNIFASPKFAPCVSSSLIKCSWT